MELMSFPAMPNVGVVCMNRSEHMPDLTKAVNMFGNRSDRGEQFRFVEVYGNKVAKDVKYFTGNDVLEVSADADAVLMFDITDEPQALALADHFNYGEF